MSYKVEFKCQGEWCSNGQAFATEPEAKHAGTARFMVWYLPTDMRVVESDEPVNYAVIDNAAVQV